ncbi:MAG: hypothetical protein K6A44_02100 [bacterium]|nr:hypothetical protein [bacterium]
MTSMIQSYVDIIQSRNKYSAPNNAQDAWRTGVRAYRPKGHIVEQSPFSIKSALNSDVNSIKYFFKGIQGKGNDYSIGRINDVAIKLGGLGIAGIIATSQGSPFKKGMEFLGLVCWLGAMSLWPKLAIHAPIKHFKGVDLDTEYVTSRGHKKRFYNDPQFICWDMISDEQISKMGDKLGVPRNIKNRRRAIEEKARQVSIQGNTLALLTAGFSTPLVASLAADKLGKHVFYPVLSKVQEARADGLIRKMSEHTNHLLVNEKAEAFITSELPEVITPKTMAGIRKVFAGYTDDFALSDGINKTLDNIFSGENIKDVSVKFDENLNKRLAGLFNDVNSQKVDLQPIIQQTAAKYNGNLNEKTIKSFTSRLLKELQIKKIITAKQAEEIKPSLVETLNGSKTFTLASWATTVEQLKDFSKLLTTYDVKVNRNFNKGLYNLVWNGAVSTNAGIWETMPPQVMKALGIDNATIKKIASAPSTEAAYDIISGVIDKIVKNKPSYDKAIKNLGVSAASLFAKDEKYLKFSLDYLDGMQKLLTAYDSKGEFAQMSNVLSSLFSAKRKDIIGKYTSAANTMFSPIRILSVLRENQGTPLYETIKKTLFECETVDAFINRLDNLKEVIRNEDQYKQLVSKVFAPISEETKSRLPVSLAKKIDDMTTLMRHLLVSQSDDVNIKYALTDSGKIGDCLRNLKIYQYADDLFALSFGNKQAVFDKIMEVINSNPQKADELKAFLRLSEADVSAIKAGTADALWQNLCGNKEVGAGFIENGRNRMKTLLNFLGMDDFSSVGDVVINKSYAGKTSSMQAPTFKNFVISSAQNMYSYNRWFKRVGLAFVGLCAITAIAIARIGKKNEFNPDIYQERKA